MNRTKSFRYLWSHLNRSINLNIARNVGSFSSNVKVQVDSKTGISTVTFQRPPVNSLSLELVNEFITAMIQIEKDKCTGMIVTSSTPGVFTAGLDLMELYKPNPDRVKSYWTAIQDMWLHLYSSSFTTVAAISGHSPGAGCLIAVSCDYRVMAQGNYGIGLNETQLGLAVPTWFVDSFRNVVPKRESELALISGKLYNVEEALKVGLIDEVAATNEDAIKSAENYIYGLSKYSCFSETLCFSGWHICCIV